MVIHAEQQGKLLLGQTTFNCTKVELTKHGNDDKAYATIKYIIPFQSWVGYTRQTKTLCSHQKH